MKHVAAVLTLVLLALLPAHAQKFSISPFYGYRFGGELENSVNGDTYSIKDKPSYGITLDFDPRDSGLKASALWSFQDTSIDLPGVTDPAANDLEVHMFQIGGLQELYDGKFRPFVAGYLGATWLNSPELGDELRFSFTLAVGANYYVTKNFGLRLDVRGYGTVTDSSGGFICANGGCLVNFSGDLVWQGEATGSLFLSF